MKSNEQLKEIRDILRIGLGEYYTTHTQRLHELVKALDEGLAMGGPLPDDWKSAGRPKGKVLPRGEELVEPLVERTAVTAKQSARVARHAQLVEKGLCGYCDFSKGYHRAGCPGCEHKESVENKCVKCGEDTK